MSAIYDATCPGCRGHVGWAGEITDRPACRQCGHRPPAEELAAAQAEEAETLRLIDLHPRDAKPNELKRQRRLAGLDLAQAAKLLGLGVFELSRAERGEASLPDDVLAKAAEVYGCGT